MRFLLCGLKIALIDLPLIVHLSDPIRWDSPSAFLLKLMSVSVLPLMFKFGGNIIVLH